MKKNSILQVVKILGLLYWLSSAGVINTCYCLSNVELPLKKNIGWNGQFYTFPYFLAFLLKRFLKER